MHFIIVACYHPLSLPAIFYIYVVMSTVHNITLYLLLILCVHSSSPTMRSIQLAIHVWFHVTVKNKGVGIMHVKLLFDKKLE